MSKETLPKQLPLHICFVVHEYQDYFAHPEELLEVYHSLTDWCDSLTEYNCKISVVIRYNTSQYLCRKKVDYYFIKDQFGPKLTFWQVPIKMHQKVVALKSDIVHTHNFNKVLQHRDLINQLCRFNIPLILQNHAETPRFLLRNIIQRRVFSQINGFLFCALGQEEIWKTKGIFSPNAFIFYLMEASTHFQKKDKVIARSITGLKGNSVILWVGHLNSNKDPLTILKAFVQVLPQFPEARLYMIYREMTLIKEVRAYIQNNKPLQKSVFLLGAKKRLDLEAYYNSADFFILGSHREGSGYAALEAIACGCIPILTTIPSYKHMTGNGKIGSLWSAGNSRTLVQAMQKAFALPLGNQSQIVRDYFNKELSYPAITQKMIQYYREIIRQSKFIN